MSKKITTWYKSQSLTIKGAIISGMFAIIAAFITLLPDNSVTVVVLPPTAEIFPTVTPKEVSAIIVSPTSVNEISLTETPIDYIAIPNNNYKIIYPSCNCEILALPIIIFLL